MKKVLFLLTLITILVTNTAWASDEGAWIKVDANGNAIGDAIVCTSDVCGNPNSLYNKLTLQPGEQYVLQFKADPVTGNVAGINARPGLKVNLETNEWTDSFTDKITVEEEINTDTTTEIIVVELDRAIVQTWNPLVTQGTIRTTNIFILQRLAKIDAELNTL